MRTSLFLVLALAWTASVAMGQGIPEDRVVVSLPSGLKYSILKAGDGGPTPGMGDKVKVHYTGWLLDGTVFDQSAPGVPAVFRLGQVIEGWNEGLTYVTRGGTIKLTIPANLAYGEAGSPPKIGPNADLVFQVELVDYWPALMVPAPWTDLSDKATTLESGIRYEILSEGEGDTLAPDQPVNFRFTSWSEGKKPGPSSSGLGRTMTVVPNGGRSPVPFWKDVLPLMKPGAVWRCEVPAAQSVEGLVDWVIEIVKPLPIPEFALPSDEELTTLDSGLQIKTVAEGVGPSPVMQTPVVCHYAGWRKRDGKLFDSSFGRGEPAEFAVGRLIPGWNEALQRMKPGGKVWLVIPSKLAYGARGAGDDIGPNEDLVFYMELLQVHN